MSESLTTQNQRIADNIQEHGWHCLHIFPVEEGHDRFSYSIGFSESYGAPEVLVFSMDPDKAHALLNECAIELRKGYVIRSGVECPNILAGDYKVVFKSVRPECFGEYLGTALRYYQEKPFDAVVMFLPDSRHRFPWEAEYDNVSADEPLSIV